jgi:uroporphyrinogen-III decarboxylase
LRSPRIAATLEAGRALLDTCPGADVRVPVCGPFALAIGLLGLNELLMTVIEEPGELADAFERLFEGQANYLRAIADAGLNPIVFESGTTPPLLPATAFETLEAPALKRLLDAAREITGQAPPCIIGGDAAPVAKALLQTGPGMVIAPSETDQAAFLETAGNFPGIHVRVNLPATVLLDPSFETVRAAAEKALALARGRPDTSVGCGVVPYEAKPETVLKLRDFLATASD